MFSFVIFLYFSGGVFFPQTPVLQLWVTEFSGKAPYREMRGFAGRERQPQSGAFRHCEPAACILGLTGANMRLSLICGFAR